MTTPSTISFMSKKISDNYYEDKAGGNLFKTIFMQCFVCQPCIAQLQQVFTKYIYSDTGGYNGTLYQIPKVI